MSVRGRTGSLWRWLGVCVLGALAILGPAGAARAQDAPRVLTESDLPRIDSHGDTAWLLISSALVFMMTAPGLALFYGGLVRRKNVLSVLMQCFFIMCLVSLQWVVLGYSLSFSDASWSGQGFLGTLQWALLKGVGQDPHSLYATTAPHLAFVIFQMMFAVITPALIVGAFAERMRFGPFCIFTLLWATLVYDPIAHWVWSATGFLSCMNTSLAAGTCALDFAGGTVVHISAGVAALACALFLGKRKGYPEKMSPPHNLPFAVIGAGLLWFGWFGFNAGSSLASNGLAASAFLVTHTAAAVAGLAWALIDWIKHGKPTVLGVITGIVAGLVSITPAAGFVDISGAIAIGLGAAVIPWFFVNVLKPKFGYDDTLDAFGVHGVGGIWGALATGLFATKAVNAAGADGLFYGNPKLFWIQIEAAGITIGYSLVLTLGLLFAVNAVCRLRANEREETVGLDLTQHKEVGYTLID